MRASWEESIRTAAQMVRAHKLRSTLTVLGVAIGVLSVISVAAIIHGLNLYVDGKVQELGSNTFLVSRFPAFVPVENWTEDIRRRKHLTAADARAIVEQCRTCVIATPMLTRFPLFGQTTEVRFRNHRRKPKAKRNQGYAPRAAVSRHVATARVLRDGGIPQGP